MRPETLLAGLPRLVRVADEARWRGQFCVATAAVVTVFWILSWLVDEPVRAGVTALAAAAAAIPTLLVSGFGMSRRVRDRLERQYLDRFRAVVEQNLALRCPELGTIPEDKRVGRSTREGKPFVLAHPRHPISRRFSDWATRLTRSRS